MTTAAGTCGVNVRSVVSEWCAVITDADADDGVARCGHRCRREERPWSVVWKAPPPPPPPCCPAYMSAAMASVTGGMLAMSVE